MQNEIDMIKKSEHPQSGTIRNMIEAINKLFNILTVGGAVVGVVNAFSLLATMSEQTEGSRTIDTVMNLFGYFTTMPSDTIIGSPFGAFVQAMLLTVAFVSVMIILKGVFAGAMVAKVHTMNSLYHNEMLTELLLTQTENGESVPAGEEPCTQAADPDLEPIPAGCWRCSCGRVNAAYVSTCACGTNKRRPLR